MSEAVQFLHQMIGRSGEEIAWWQMCLRAVIILLFGLLMVRVAGKRLIGKWSAIDLVVAVILGSNLSRALTGNSPLFGTLAASAVLVGLHGVLTSLALHVPGLGRVLKGRPTRIVLNGAPDAAAMRRHGVGRHDLEEALREGGVLDCEDVKEAWIERNGEISVIKR